jgi:beta-1,4-mannosyltransferase
MLNHATELVAQGNDVVLIGYRTGGFEPPKGARVRPLHPRERVAEGRSKWAFLWGSALRMGLLAVELVRALRLERPKIVLVQNPPSFPTLAAARLGARGARLIVDWHNYGYSLLALRLAPDHPAVRASRWYEGVAGRLGDAHFCVSEAMRRDLAARFSIDARVLRDMPLALDRPARAANPAPIAVCPAGWTADEDMDMLVDALDRLKPSCPIQVHLTGTGPRRAHYDPRISKLRDSGFDIRTGFLPEEEYRDLLRRADFGLSLHGSSSGLDLAMKVVDLYAAGVPVCALDYGDTVREQIEDGATGRLFRTAEELAAILGEWAGSPGEVNLLRRNVQEKWARTWHEEWRHVASPQFTERR